MVRHKLWQVWPAQNRFCCDGLCMMGPAADGCPLWTGWCSLVAAGALFAATSAPYLWEHVSIVWPIVGAILWGADVYFYARATFMDPGILPRSHLVRLLTNPSSHQHRVSLLAAEKMLGDIYQNNATPTQEVKRCATCDIERPPLSNHCNQCDNCVEIWDHHCNWIGNCVGQRNHRMFVSFVTASTLLCFYFVIAPIVHLVDAGGVSNTFQDIGALILIIAMILTSCFMVSMSSYHLGLVASGETLKMRNASGNDNGDCGAMCTCQGCVNLWTFFCCYSARTSLIHTKETLDA